jgi:Glycosyltransferase family 87
LTLLGNAIKIEQFKRLYAKKDSFPVHVKNGIWQPAIFLLSIFLVIGLFTWINYRFIIPLSALDEFRNAWLGANGWLLQGQNPYNTIAGFNIPFIAMFFYLPLGLLDFTLARAIWLTIIESSLFLLVIIGINFSGWKVQIKSLPFIILTGLVMYSGIRAIFLGQFSVLVILMIYGGIFLISKKQDVLGGFLLALSISQPETAILLLVFITIWSLATKRHQLLVSLLSGMAFLIILSIILLPGWPIQWLRSLFGPAGTLVLYTSMLSKFANSVPGIRQGLSLVLNLGVLFLLVIEWVTSIKDAQAMFIWLVMITMVVNSLIKLRADTVDIIGLLPVIFYILMVIQEKWKSLANGMAYIIFISLVLLPWLINISLWRQGNLETFSFNLILSLVCLMALVWIKWWAHQSQRLPLESLIERLS